MLRGPRTIWSSVGHAIPLPALRTVVSDVGAPPPMRTFVSLSPATNASHWPSGEKARPSEVGSSAPSTRRAAASSLRTYSRDTDADSAMYATCRPSRETARRVTWTPELTGMSKRTTGRTAAGRRPSHAHAATPADASATTIEAPATSVATFQVRLGVSAPRPDDRDLHRGAHAGGVGSESAS